MTLSLLSSLAMRVTLAPEPASCFATAKPNPLELPPTKALFPFKSIFILFLTN